MENLPLDVEDKPLLGRSLGRDRPSRYTPAPRGQSWGTQASPPYMPCAPTLSLSLESLRMLPMISLSTQVSSCSLGACSAMPL